MGRDSEIINIVLSKTHIDTYKKCMENFNIQGLYENRKNEILYKYFDGHQQKYSIEMARIFRRFGTAGELFTLADSKEKINSLQVRIKLIRRYGNGESETLPKLIEDYNGVVSQYNEIQKRTIEPLRKMYNKVLKSKKNGG